MKKQELVKSENTDKTEITNKKQSSFVGAFILIILGIILLLNNFGLLPWSIWRIWPIFLIFWGFQIIFGKSKIANFLLIAISLLIAAFFLLTSVVNSNPQIRDYLEKTLPYLQLPRYENNRETDWDDDWQLEFEQDWRRELELP